MKTDIRILAARCIGVCKRAHHTHGCGRASELAIRWVIWVASQRGENVQDINIAELERIYPCDLSTIFKSAVWQEYIRIGEYDSCGFKHIVTLERTVFKGVTAWRWKDNPISWQCGWTGRIEIQKEQALANGQMRIRNYEK
jgi:hypothetical protein